MRFLIWILLIFALAVGITLAGKFDPGYAILVYPPYRIELSLILFTLLLLGVIVLGAGFFRFAVAILNLPRQARDYRQRQRQQAGETALLNALRADLAQQPETVEVAARRAIELDYQPQLAARLIARAAEARHNLAMRDQYLDLARKYPDTH
jgi:HemY protein